MLPELKRLNIKGRLNFHSMCLRYKWRKGLVPQYLTETFSNVTDKHEHQLKRSFKYSGALNWNNLNPIIRNATSLNIFKSAYLKSHFNH